MNNAALYSTIYRARGLTRIIAKVFAWLFGIQLAVLYLLASIADAPLTQLAGPGFRFALVLAVLFIGPRIFDAVLSRLAARG